LSPQQSDCSKIMFLQRYQQKYGTCPSNAAIHGYEAARLAIRAIADVGRKDRRAIVESAFASRVDDGVLGDWSIDVNGDTTLREVSVSVVRNGTFEHEEVVPAAGIGKKNVSR
jgi:ABC-type branched-subunit amino acid transport system substrate-binding protein